MSRETTDRKRIIVEFGNCGGQLLALVINVEQSAPDEKTRYLLMLTRWALILSNAISLHNVIFVFKDSATARHRISVLTKLATIVDGHITLLFWSMLFPKLRHKTGWVFPPHGGTWACLVLRNALLNELLYDYTYDPNASCWTKTKIISLAICRASAPAIIVLTTYGVFICIWGVVRHDDPYHEALPWSTDLGWAAFMSVLSLLATPVTTVLSQLSQRAIQKMLNFFSRQPSASMPTERDPLLAATHPPSLPLEPSPSPPSLEEAIVVEETGERESYCERVKHYCVLV